jgi:hypothetical protein
MATFINPGVFTIGPNCTISIIDILTGNEVDFGLLTQGKFTTSTVTQRTPINLMSGIREDLVFYQGWKGDFTVYRTNSNLDVIWSNYEALVRAGLNPPIFNIIQTIKESNGTISRYTFLNGQLTYDEAGTFENEAPVMQTFNFTAPAREALNN